MGVNSVRKGVARADDGDAPRLSGPAATNQGKGAAVTAGLRQAGALGFTHALQVDADGTSSMNDDLTRGRPTEVDILQGEVARIARRVGQRAPVCERVAELVHEAEKAGERRRQWTGDQLLAELRRAQRRANRAARAAIR